MGTGWIVVLASVAAFIFTLRGIQDAAMLRSLAIGFFAGIVFVCVILYFLEKYFGAFPDGL